MYVTSFQFLVTGGAFFENFQRIFDAITTVDMTANGGMWRLNVFQANGTTVPKLFLWRCFDWICNFRSSGTLSILVPFRCLQTLVIGWWCLVWQIYDRNLDGTRSMITVHEYDFVVTVGIDGNDRGSGSNVGHLNHICQLNKKIRVWHFRGFVQFSWTYPIHQLDGWQMKWLCFAGSWFDYCPH